jgi:hypothetical protein
MMSLRGVVGSVLFVFVARTAWAVGGCPDVPGPAGQAITQYVSKNGVACQDGSYLKLGGAYDADFLTTVYGACELHYVPPSCPVYQTDYRYIGSTSITEVGVSGWTIVVPNPNNYSTSTLDTRALNTSTPDTPSWTFYYEGARQLNTQSNLSTNCSSSVNSIDTTKTYNVVKCEPKFWNRHLDTSEISINLASTSPYTLGLDEAISDWNSRLGGTGVHLNRATAGCINGPQCINVLNDSTMSTCGYTNGDPDSNGVIYQNGVIYINNSLSFTYTGLQRTFEHEIGHLLGLDNSSRTACGVNDAVMQDLFFCEQTNSTIYAQTSDWLPVTKSVYGGGTVNTCGW